MAAKRTAGRPAKRGTRSAPRPAPKAAVPAPPAPALPARTTGSIAENLQIALSWLEQQGTPNDRDNLARFGITAPKAFGVSMANIQTLGKHLGRSHELAAALWDSGWYEARLLTSFVDVPARVTPAQMDRWCRDFDNWAICDTVCFHLFDRTPHAWAKAVEWSAAEEEFVKRAGFVLIASLAGHDKGTGDQPFLDSLVLIERAAGDERNFVRKGVSWALRRIGRRNAALHAASVEVAHRLSTADPASQWIGRAALRELLSPAVKRQIAGRRPARARTR